MYNKANAPDDVTGGRVTTAAYDAIYGATRGDLTLMILSHRFDEAFVYAADLHREQVRKGTTIPYIAHLMAVASIVLEYGGDEDQAIAALLHDAIEDQGGARTREDIRVRFGDTVVSYVDACTDAEEVPKPPWRIRKEQYIARLAHEPPEALLVSAADKLHNVRDILKDLRGGRTGLWEVFKGGKSGTLWYYRALVDAYRAVMRSPLIDELGRAVDDLERVAGERGPVEEGTASLPTDLFHVNPTDAPDLGIRNQD